MLFNMQHVPGFDEELKEMAPNGPGPLYAEFEAASSLGRAPGVVVHFRPPNNIAGESYDLDLWIDDLYLCGEVKAKLDPGKPSANGVIDALRKARKNNLPSDKPSVVWIRFPAEWVVQPEGYVDDLDLIEEIKVKVSQHLANTDRIVAVVIAFSVLMPVDKFVMETIITIPIYNLTSRFADARLDNLDAMDADYRGWVRLVDLWGPLLKGFDTNAMVREEAIIRRAFNDPRQ